MPQVINQGLTLGALAAVSAVGYFCFYEWRRRSSVNKSGFGDSQKIESVGKKYGIRLGGKEDGIVLGGLARKVISFFGEGNIALFGGSGSGKTFGTIIPTLLRWPHSAFVVDPKGEICEETAGWRSTFSDIISLSFNDRRGPCYNPLAEVRAGDKQIPDIHKLVEVLYSSQSEGSYSTDATAIFFAGRCKKLMLGLILHVIHDLPQDEKKLSSVNRLIALFETKTMNNMKQSGDCLVKEIGEEFAALNDRTRSGVTGHLSNVFRIFDDPIVAHKTGMSHFALSDLACADRPITCYLRVAADESDSLKPLMRIFIMQLSQTLIENKKSARGKLKQREVLLIVDETAIPGRMDFLITLLRLGRGYGVKTLIAFQSPKDMAGIYGRDNPIMSCCHVKIYANVDPEYAPIMEKMMPVVTRKKKTKTFHPGKWFPSTSTHSHDRPAMYQSDLTQMSFTKQIVVIGNLPPFIVDKITWKDRRFPRVLWVEPTCEIPIEERVNDKTTDGVDAKDYVKKFISISKRSAIPERKLARLIFPELPESSARHLVGGRRPFKNEHVLRISRLMELVDQRGGTEDALTMIIRDTTAMGKIVKC